MNPSEIKAYRATLKAEGPGIFTETLNIAIDVDDGVWPNLPSTTAGNRTGDDVKASGRLPRKVVICLVAAKSSKKVKPLRINIYRDQMLEAERFGKPVLYTGSSIPREEVLKGWYCCDLCGTGRYPGKSAKLMDQAPWNHTGTVLSPTPLKRETTLYRTIKGRFFLTGRSLTLAAFCQECSPPQAHAPRKFIPRPASPKKAGLFYALPPERDEELGVIGHARIDFGRSGKEFWHTWWPRGSQELNTQEFKDELGDVVDELLRNVLKDLDSMRSCCYTHGGEIEGGFCFQNHGFLIEAGRYLYRLRCSPISGDYQACFSCVDKQAQKLGLAEKGLQALQDAAAPVKAHSYRWYVIENINDPGHRVDHDLPIITPEQFERVEKGRQQRAAGYEAKCAVAWKTEVVLKDGSEVEVSRPPRMCLK